MRGKGFWAYVLTYIRFLYSLTGLLLKGLRFTAYYDKLKSLCQVILSRRLSTSLKSSGRSEVKHNGSSVIG